MRYRAVIPYSKNYANVNRYRKKDPNKYWVRTYVWDDSIGKYGSEVSDRYTDKEAATSLFRSIEISKEIPRAELWGKTKNKKLRMFTYKGLK